MIGLEEKVAKFWRSLNPQIRQEMFRRDLDPDVDSWTVVVDGAVRAERVVNLESEPKVKSQKNRQNGNSSARKNAPPNLGSLKFRGRGGRSGQKARHEVRRISAVDLSDASSKPLSNKKPENGGKNSHTHSGKKISPQR
jgi:hypothetical protein